MLVSELCAKVVSLNLVGNDKMVSEKLSSKCWVNYPALTDGAS